MKYFLILLFVVSSAFATTVNVGATHDTFTDSTNLTFNYGALTSYYVGNRTGTVKCDMLVRFDYSGIASNVTVNSAICTLWTPTINNADGWYVRFRTLDSAWVEGTGVGAAFQDGSASWLHQGWGANNACDGSSIAQANRFWGPDSATTMTSPPKGGAWSTAVIDSEIINSTTDSTIVVDLTSAVQAQISSGKNYGFLLYGTSTVSSRRVIIACRDFTETAGLKRPKLTIDYDPPGDSTFIRIAVTPPSIPLSDYPVSVNWLTYPGLATSNFTLWKSDSTTKLYCCIDSMSGHYTRAWVINDWTTSPERIFVSAASNPSYQNCDSVFLIYDAFTANSLISEPITTNLTQWNSCWVDTASPFLNFYEGAGDADESDSLYRENSRVIYDWQESDPNLRYKWFYTGQQTRPDPDRYAGNWLHWASAPTWAGTWTKKGYLLDSDADTINVEDFNVTWSSYWSKWFALCEDHNFANSDVMYAIGLYSADSLDGTWTFERDVLDSMTIGWPTNWLSREQASPATYVNTTGDTAWCVFEAFSTNSPDPANSRMGAMISYNNGPDSLFYDWHLLDSTGAVNAANPMPIIRTDVAGQPDRLSTIPNFLHRQADGTWFTSNHGAGPLNFEYYGSGFNSANLLLQLPVDSSVITDDWGWDPLSNSWIGSVGRDTFAKSGQDTVSNRSAVMHMRMEIFDSTWWTNTKWTIHHRSTKPSSYAHYKTSTVRTDNGILTMYPIQYMETGVVALRSTATLTKPYVVEIMMQETTPGFLDQYNLNISLGDDTLQSYTGGQTDAAAWQEAGTQRGFRLKVNPTATRFRKDSTGIADQSIGSTVAMPTDSVDEMRLWRIYHTSDDSLIFTVNGVSKIRAKNPEAAYTSTPKHLLIAQSEEGLINRGGVFRADFVRARKYTNADGTAITSDTLETQTQVTSGDDFNWRLWDSWKPWRHW